MMKQLWKSLISLKLSLIVLTVFIVIIATATFIENAYDTISTKLLIYHATWFEVLMLLFVVFYVILIFKRNLLRKDKIPQLLFHFSFAFIILGGGVTRNFGFEANMHIFEKESSNTLYTLEPYFQLRTTDGKNTYNSSKPVYFSQLSDKTYNFEFELEKPVHIDLKNYVYNESSPDSLQVALTYDGKIFYAVLYYDDTKTIQKFKPYVFDDLNLEMVYGPKPISMPFSLQLERFTLSKYPGTNIPSASESEVVLIDERNDLKVSHILSKNNVLDYDGYRFFQTSYDEDEKGTILSVNYDFYGTRITYFGYILLVLGALMIMWSKRSHFSQLDNKIKEVRARRKALTITIFLLLNASFFGFSQNEIRPPVSESHADTFGHLYVQTYDGRFTPVHTLATDVIHKITGKDHISTPNKGKMDAMHLFLDMHLDPEYWKNQAIIKVREKALRDILGITGSYASFYDFDDNGYFKLEELANKAYVKKASEQTTLDRELIKVSERVFIFMNVINGTTLKLFPSINDQNHTWISWDEPKAQISLPEALSEYNRSLNLQEFNYSNIMRSYFLSTIPARENSDYSRPNEILGHIKSIQKQLTPPEMLPSEQKISLEVFYNKVNIFDFLKYCYAFLGIILLVLSVIDNFRVNSNKFIPGAIKIGMALFLVLFAVQTAGMGLRWYLGGHAPWSNGYEVILLVAWGTIIAGFTVVGYSKITLATTALLTSILLMVAGLSYYDPQLTNLNPVLKSHWLIIHVAIITIGYGFLALSFMLGLINIIIGLFKSSAKEKLYTLIIAELTFINEKLLTVGMLLTAAGTYIGCVWANESWGTYWSWNAKQTWSLIIILAYGLILHFKYIPRFHGHLTFNIASVVSFGSVIMTFVGVNYYFTKGLHSYASDDPPVFPLIAWIGIAAFLVLILIAIIREYQFKKRLT